MRFFMRLKGSVWVAAAAVVAASAAFCVGAALAASEDEKPFLDANAKAMNAMMAGMDIHASGDVDIDFAAMMIPHHQGAIEMARAELQYGTNEQLRRIAQEIIVDQDQEIAAMRLAVNSAHVK